MSPKPLLSGRGWRLVGWLTTIFFTLFTVYAAAMLIYTLMESAA